MSFFSRLFKKPAPAEPVLPQTPGFEEPQEVVSAEGLIHPPSPRGTRFNRKVVMTLGAVAGLVAIFAFMAALQPPRKLTAQEQAEKNDAGSEAAPARILTPETIAAAPDTYAAKAKFDEEQQMKRGPLPAAEAGEQVGNIQAVSPQAINAYNATAQSPMISEAQRQIIEARKSPIRFTQASAVQNPQQAKPFELPQLANAQLPLIPQERERDDQNMQTEKRDFVEKQKKAAGEFYVKGPLTKPLSRFEVKAGSIIPGVMITGINSDLPGQLVGQVRENVYDTVSGHYLLIPQGTRIVGVYDSKVAYAQERVLIIWTRLIYPNGDSLNLEGMPGVDLSGYAGMTDQVNNHYGKLITGVILSSVLGAGAKVAAGNNDFGQANFGQQAASGAAEQINNVGTRIAERNLNVQPTIEIRPGQRFNVFVNKDLILKPYKRS